MAANIVSMQEYFGTSYEGDREYIDGEVRGRNVGLHLHSWTMATLIGLLDGQTRRAALKLLPSLRLRVGQTRVRVPDLCVLRKEAPRERIPTYPPLLVIEILAEEDTFEDLQERVADYIAMGVSDVWAIDPGTWRAYVCAAGEFAEFSGDTLRIAGSEIHVRLADLWAELER